MPSHELHLKWASLYGIPWHIASEVNRIIDSKYGIHDLGEVKQRRIISGNIEIPLRPEPTVFKLKDILMLEFPDRRDYELAVKASLLHHFLDKIERYLKEYGSTVISDSEKVIDHAKKKMYEHHLNLLSREEFMRVYLFLKRHSNEVISDILEDMKNKGRSIDYIGPSELSELLKKYIEKRGYKKLILILSHIFDKRPLPLTSAAKKIFYELKKGNHITLQFVIKTRPFISATRSYTFKSLKELIEFLKSQ